MHHYLNTLRCQHNHEHTHVAGSFKDHEGFRLNVSAFTELYTQVFGSRIARTFAASKNVSEESCVHNQTVFAEEVEDAETEPAVKRRRLAFKVTNPPGYPEHVPSDQSQRPMPNAEAGSRSETRNPMEESPSGHDVCKQLLQQALQLAPRVGTRILHDGDLFDSLQRAFPEKKLRVIELCKGADRFRKPPTKLISHEAPWRRTCL
jgi:hypothetical protein